MENFLNQLKDRELRQVITFLAIIVLVAVLVIAVLALKMEVSTFLYAICFLTALLVVMVVSGGIEINLGSLFKIKKDTEEIKKEMANLRVFLKATQSQNNSPTFNVSLTSTSDVATKYYQPDEEPLDIEDTDENAFYNTSGTSDTIKL